VKGAKQDQRGAPLDDAAFARLPTEASAAEAADLDVLPARRVVALLARRERQSVAAVERAAPQIARVAAAAARAFAAGGRLIYVGAGTSGRLGVLDASECPPTFGTPPGQVVGVIAGGAAALVRAVEGAEDRADDARAALRRLRLGRADVVVAIAASGVTPFARAALEAAHAVGALCALVTCAPAAARAAGARPDVLVGLEVGPEILAGSTRLGAGTATKITLNAITTAAMVRAGRCYGARMVDLRASSAKLRARARRLVVDLTDLDAAHADALLGRAGGSVKTAVVMARRKLSRADAERRLAAADGRLRRVIGAPGANPKRKPR
jgi:N-acetylmuramic acid 6-phosphate etherase